MSKNLIIGILCFLILLGTFAFGYYRYPKWHPCPETTSDTVRIVDTVIHVIPDTIPYYIVRVDSVIYRDTVFRDVDTANILSNYFALHYYTRNFEDTLLKVTLKDVVSENRFISSQFEYQILRPQMIVNNVTNTVNYSRYLYLGGSVVIPDSKYSNIGLFYASGRSLIGVGYIPFEKGVSVTMGFKMAKY